MNTNDAKFFRPLWRRVLVTGVITVWFILEAVFTHDQLWMGVTGVGIAYCVWNFFLRFPKAVPEALPTNPILPAASPETASPAEPPPKP